MSITRDMILDALRSIPDPATGADVVSAGLVGSVAITGGKVGFVVTITAETAVVRKGLDDICKKAVEKLDGVSEVTVIMTAHNDAPATEAPAPRAKAQWNKNKLPYVKSVIAVASGKGGVGKSTVTVNLALALKEAGLRVGVLDADIYGPSIPRMMGLATRSQPHIENGKMVPPVSFGLKAMSMGFILGREAAVMRGPMITKALQQLLRSVIWGTADDPLDLLLVDMPPGTGDIHISMAQQVPLSGAIIVTTPQEVAVADADKCIQMFEKLGAPILGVVENMSYFVDPAGAKHHLFGTGGGEQLATTHNTKFLGALPLDPLMGTCADNGENYLKNAGAAAAAIFHEIAADLKKQFG